MLFNSDIEIYSKLVTVYTLNYKLKITKITLLHLYTYFNNYVINM